MWRAPRLGDVLGRNLRAAVLINGQRVSRRALGARAAAEEFAELVELRTNLTARNLARALARIHVEKQPVCHLRARAGEAGQRHGAMAVLERQLDRHTERVAILRPMA